MRDYIIKRLLQGFLLIFCVSIIVFSMLYLMPGDPISHVASNNLSNERLEELREEYGFNRPLHEQYFSWLKRIVLEQDFGTSYKNKLPVWDLLKVRIPVSIKLTGSILFFQLLTAIPLGVLCALKKDTLFDRITVTGSLIAGAIPSFWLAVLLMLFFSIRLNVLPISGNDTWLHYVLPVVTGVMSNFAATLRLTKTEAIDVIREKYVLTAYAKGLPRKSVVVKHVLRNSLMIVVVLAFMSIPFLISGLVIIERVFAIPGMGNLMVTAIIQQDFPIVQASMMIIATLTVVCNITCDIVLGILDPRIRIAISGGDK